MRQTGKSIITLVALLRRSGLTEKQIKELFEEIENGRQNYIC